MQDVFLFRRIFVALCWVEPLVALESVCVCLVKVLVNPVMQREVWLLIVKTSVVDKLYIDKFASFLAFY